MGFNSGFKGLRSGINVMICRRASTCKIDPTVLSHRPTAMYWNYRFTKW